MLSERQEEILAAIRANPLVAQQELANRLGISRSAVAGHIKQLTDSGLIRGRGYFLNESDYVCVLGGANVDIEGRVPGRLLMGDSNPGTLARSPGGVARNIAENLARLGVPTRLITALGRDPNGVWLHDRTVSAGVDLVDCVWSESEPTATYLSVIDGSGEMAVAVNDMAVMETLDATAVEARSDTLSRAAAVVADCNLNSVALERITELAGGPLFVDPVSVAKADRIAPYLQSVHTIKPNRAEAAHLTGIEVSSTRDLESAAAALLDAGVQRVVISLGADGVFYADREISGSIAAEDRHVASVTGAGDALMAGLVHAERAGLPLREAVSFGMAAASLATSSTSPVAAHFSTGAISELTKKDPP